MQGYAALWVPGADHAGIATQIKVEEELRKNEGLSSVRPGPGEVPGAGVGLEEPVRQPDRRAAEEAGRLAATGTGPASPWTRACSKAVREVFVSLYKKGLIYKGCRIINWCPHCVTALCDAEVEYAG